MKINWQLIARLACAGFLSLLLWACGRLISQQDKILVKLNVLEMEIVKLKASMMTEDFVRVLIRDELRKEGK